MSSLLSEAAGDEYQNVGKGGILYDTLSLYVADLHIKGRYRRAGRALGLCRWCMQTGKFTC